VARAHVVAKGGGGSVKHMLAPGGGTLCGAISKTEPASSAGATLRAMCKSCEQQASAARKG
jgi:hypothetical protein